MFSKAKATRFFSDTEKQMLSKFLILLFLHHTYLQAGCFDSIAGFFNINPYHVTLSPETVEKVSMNDDLLFPILKLTNIPEEHFFYLLNLYPNEVASVLSKYPQDTKLALFYKSGLQEALNIPNYNPTSTIQSLVDYIHRHQSSPKNIAEWLEKGLKKIRNLVPEEYQKLQKNTALFMREAEATYNFKTKYYVSLPMLVNKNKEKVLVVNNQTYLVQSDDPKNFVILVPKDKVKHPIWNPLERGKRESIIKNPEGNQPPEAYYTGVGLDGNFYLEDGNHRFYMLEKRELIPVRIIYPPRTLTLSHYIYYVSNFAPTTEEMLKVLSHEKNPMDIIPIELKKTIIFKPNQLQKK